MDIDAEGAGEYQSSVTSDGVYPKEAQSCPPCDEKLLRRCVRPGWYEKSHVLHI